MAEHTPTPWHLQYRAVRDNSGKVIAGGEVPWSGATNADYDLAAANAAHIVKCVNSHDALVGALKAILKHGELGNVGTGGWAGNKPTGNPMSKDVWQFPRHMLVDIEAALASAQRVEGE